MYKKTPILFGRDGATIPASEWPKLGGAKQGDQGPCWSHQQPPVFAFFGKSSHDFLTSCYLHFFASLTQNCQVQWFESILNVFMNRSPFLLSKVFQLVPPITRLLTVPIWRCSDIWGHRAFFRGLKARQGVPFSGLIWNYICVLPSPTQSTPDGSSASHPLSFDPINHTPGPRRLFASTKSGGLVNFGLFPSSSVFGFLFFCA